MLIIRSLFNSIRIYLKRKIGHLLANFELYDIERFGLVCLVVELFLFLSALCCCMAKSIEYGLTMGAKGERNNKDIIQYPPLCKSFLFK